MYAKINIMCIHMYMKCPCICINGTSKLQSDVQMLEVAIYYFYDIGLLFYLFKYFLFGFLRLSNNS